MKTKREITYNLSERQTKKYRIFEIDFVRACAIILVMIDHLFYDLILFGKIWSVNEGFFESIFYPLMNFAIFYWNNPVRIFIRNVVLAIFFFISGTSSAFSRNNFKRSFKMIAFAFALTLATWLFSLVTNSAAIIYFNAIHVFAFSTLIYSLVEHAHPAVPFSIAILGIGLNIFLNLYQPSASSMLLIPFGIYPPNLFPLDSMSMLPWLSFFLLGGIVGKKLYSQKVSLFKKEYRGKLNPPLLFVGRHSLYFYFGHQVVYFILFAIVGVIAFGF